MKKYASSILITALVVATIVFVVFALKSNDKSSSNPPPTKVSDSDIKAIESGHATGPDNAKVVLTEFGDFQCPACGEVYQSLKVQVLPLVSGKIKFVFKEFPLTNIHKNAAAAALAAEAANAQDKFWPMHDLLYEKQSEWTEAADPLDNFVGYAQTLGLDTSRFRSEVQNKKYQDVITQDVNLGTKLNIPGTPTFFINGQVFNIKDTQKLNDLLDALNAAGANAK